MYLLLCGSPPFAGADDEELLSEVRIGHVRFGKDWCGVSGDAKELVRRLICKDPKERYTAERALGHQWIKHTAPKAENVPLDTGFVDKLRAFRCHNKFAKAALHVIAQQANEAQVKGLREAFLSLDKNNDGMLSLAEMKEGLGRAGVSVPAGDIQAIMDGIDADCSGVIDYTEFLAAMMERKEYLQVDVCWSAFRVFDLDGDGKVSKSELATMLRGGGDSRGVLDADTCAEVLKEVDRNGDGVVDFDEFMSMLRGARSGALTASDASQ
jgi:calcium-dependent protein kinase